MSHKTVAPRYDGKVVHYFSDGSGRDDYIWKINGGLFKEKTQQPSGFQIGTFGGHRQYKPINNYRPAKHVHYPTDGTGRDIYIKSDEGGLSGQQWKRPNFINGLRGYEKIRFSQDNDFLSKSQFIRPSTASSMKSLNKSTVDEQQRSSNRLSRPKTAKDPYQEMKGRPTLLGLRTLYG